MWAGARSSVRDDQLDDVVGQVAELLLRDVEHRQEGRLLGRIPRQEPSDPLLRLR